jgi:hypothetical protein
LQLLWDKIAAGNGILSLAVVVVVMILLGLQRLLVIAR